MKSTLSHRRHALGVLMNLYRFKAIGTIRDREQSVKYNAVHELEIHTLDTLFLASKTYHTFEFIG